MNISHLSLVSPHETTTTGDSMTEMLLTNFAAFQRGKGLAETTVRNRESILRTFRRNADRPLLWRLRLLLVLQALSCRRSVHLDEMPTLALLASIRARHAYIKRKEPTSSALSA